MIPIVSSLIILFINLITTEYLTKKKFKGIYRYLIILLFTIIYYSFIQWLFPLILGQETPYYISALISWVFIFLFFAIYDEPFKILVAIMGFTYSHTLFVNGLNYHIFSLLYEDHRVVAFVVSQLLMFIITTPILIYLLKKSIMRATTTFKQNVLNASIFLPLLNFFVFFISRFIIDFNSVFSVILFYSTLLSMSCLTYYLIYIVTISSSNIKELSDLVYIDPLTKLKNRLALYQDYKEYCKNDQDCYFYYLDINNLKKVNDQYGHITGDKYLKSFGSSLLQSIKGLGDIYRISGDEFVITSKEMNFSIDKLKEDITKNFKFNYPFLGVSIGCVTFPTDAKTLDELLFLADQKMYMDKKNKD